MRVIPIVLVLFGTAVSVAGEPPPRPPAAPTTGPTADSMRYDLALHLARRTDAILLDPQRDPKVQLDHLRDTAFAAYESAHFVIRHPEAYSRRLVEQIAAALESGEQRLRAWVPLSWDRPVEVTLFPANEFQRAYGDRVFGVFDGTMRIPVIRTLEARLVEIDTLAHELAHAMVDEYAGPDVPLWFQEGLAQYVEERRPRENPIQALAAEGQLVSLSAAESVLSGDGEEEFLPQAYAQSVWAVRAINARYGLTGLRDLLDAFTADLDTRGAVRVAFRAELEDFERGLWEWCLSAAADQVLADGIEAAAQRRIEVPLEADQDSELVADMRQWHRYYARQVKDVRGALRRVVRLLRGEEDARLAVVCRELESGATSVLADPRVFAAPDGDVAYNLRFAYRHIRYLASNCLQARSGPMHAELVRAELALKATAILLEPYGLVP